MNYKIVPMAARKKIALVAHDNKKQDLFDWAKFNRDLLDEHVLYATGTTGSVLEQEFDLRIHKLESGPLGGDQQIGARICTDCHATGSCPLQIRANPWRFSIRGAVRAAL